MPSAIIMSSSLRESIASEVQVIRRALEESFRLSQPDTDDDDSLSSISYPHNSSSTNNNTSDDATTDEDGIRLYAVLSTHRSEDQKEATEDGRAPSDEENNAPVKGELRGMETVEPTTGWVGFSKSFDRDGPKSDETESSEEDYYSDDEQTKGTYSEFAESDDSDTGDSGPESFFGDETQTDAEGDGGEGTESEVAFYHNGATELFLSLEERKWEDSARILRSHPRQAKIWVIFTNNETADDWNCLWKRLPLHEAVRQHAPLALIDQLVQVYSGACRECTQFGELPLHLALDNGVCPEVVHLLLLHNIMAFRITDQSGRMPVEILSDARQLNAAAHRSLVHVFRAVQQSWNEIQAVHQQNVKAVEDRHAKSYVRETYANAAMVQAEIDKQQELRDEIESITKAMRQQKETYEATIHNIEVEALELKKSLKASQIATARVSRDMEDAEVAHQQEVAKLQNVLKRAVRWRSPQVGVVQNKIETSSKALETLRDTLTDHRDDLEGLLENIGVEPMFPPLETVDGPPEELTE